VVANAAPRVTSTRQRHVMVVTTIRYTLELLIGNVANGWRADCAPPSVAEACNWPRQAHTRRAGERHRMPGQDTSALMTHLKDRLVRTCPPSVALTAHAAAGDRSARSTRFGSTWQAMNRNILLQTLDDLLAQGARKL
jgi:hypothetical protein